MSRSEKLLHMTRSQWDLNDFFLCNISSFPPYRTRSIAEHQLIIDKIAEKDAAGARTLMEAHISTFTSLIQRTFTNS